jgi:hypothetical protein
MFDSNILKKKVKEWMRNHPNGTEKDLQDFCESIIPPQHYYAQEWLVEHTLSWYRYILDHRRQQHFIDDEAFDSLD